MKSKHDHERGQYVLVFNKNGAVGKLRFSAVLLGLPGAVLLGLSHFEGLILDTACRVGSKDPYLCESQRWKQRG